MHAIAQKIGAIMEDRRADYVFNTKVAAEAVRCHPNKFHARWYRTRDWLIDLVVAQPGQAAVEFAAIMAMGLAERERRGLDSPPPPRAQT